MAVSSGGTGDASRRYWHGAGASGGWLGGLPADKHQAVLGALQFRHLEPGETLYAQGDEPRGLFGIASGAVHTIGVSAEGQPSLLSVMRAGEWTGFLGVLDGKPAPFTTVAASPVDLAILPLADARTIFGADKESLSLLAAPLIQILRYAFTYLIETNNRSPSRMVAQRLMDLSRCIYLEGSTPGSVIDWVSQEDVAAASYLTRPTVNRVFKDMAAKGMIEVGYGRITIRDVAAVDAMAKGMAGSHGGRPPKQAPDEPAPEFREAGRVEPEARSALLKAGWLPTLPADIQNDILSSVIATKCRQGEKLYAQGQRPLGLYAVATGHCHTTATAMDGRPFLFSILHPGFWTGFVPALDGGPQPFSVTAPVSTTAFLLPAKAMAAIFYSSAERYRLLLTPVLGMLRAIYGFLIDANRGSPRRMVAQRLRDLARLPYLEEDSLLTYSVSLTQHDLAAATGLSRLSVNRAVAELEALGAITRSYGKIAVSDPQELTRLARLTSD